MQKDSKRPQRFCKRPSDLLAAWSNAEPHNCKLSSNFEIPVYWIKEPNCDRWSLISVNSFIEHQWRVVTANVFAICGDRGWPIFLSCIAKKYQADIKLIGDFWCATASSQLENSPAESLLAAYLAALQTEKMFKEESIEVQADISPAASKQVEASGNTERSVSQAKILQLVKRRDRPT